MSVKKVIAGVVRKVSPKRLTRVVEGSYRGARRMWFDAAYKFPAKGMKIIGVTGTNGKTTTVNMINEILKAAGLKTAMFSTAVIEVAGERKLNDLNLTVLPSRELMQFFDEARKADVDYVVLEVSSHALDQKKMSGLEFEVAVITNLTQDHLDYHMTMGRYARAKGKLFSKKPRFIVLNGDDKEWFKFFDRYEAGERKISYGHESENDLKIVSSKLYRRGTEARLLYGGDEFEVATEIPGEYNVGNMAAAAGAALLLEIGIEKIQDGVANLSGLPGRFEYVEFGGDGGKRKPEFDVAVDYAHTPDGLLKLLQSVRKIIAGSRRPKGRVVLVFGAMGERDAAKRPIMGQIAAENADLVFVTDEENDKEDRAKIRGEILEGVRMSANERADVSEIPDRRKAIEAALVAARMGDIVLIAGMGHETYRLLDGERIMWNDSEEVKDVWAEIESTRR